MNADGHPTNFDMITTGGYFPAVGRNTIRKMSPKYKALMPGDRVTMYYCEQVNAEGHSEDTIAVEHLTVASVAKAPFNVICAHHLERNHAVRTPTQEAEVFDRLSDLYDVQDGDNEQFAAIYFA